MPFLPAPNETEFYYARLPFNEAQTYFRSEAPETHLTRVANCGWHGTWFDEKRGSFGIVNADSVLSDWVGERLLVVYDTGTTLRAVAVYVHAASSQMDSDEDLTITRRAYIALELPSTTPIEVLACPVSALGSPGQSDAFAQFLDRRAGSIITAGL